MFRVDVRGIASNTVLASSCVGKLLVSSMPAVVFADGEFDLADWSANAIAPCWCRALRAACRRRSFRWGHAAGFEVWVTTHNDDGAAIAERLGAQWIFRHGAEMIDGRTRGKTVFTR